MSTAVGSSTSCWSSGDEPQGKSRLVSYRDAPLNFPSFTVDTPTARQESEDMVAPAARCSPESTQPTEDEQESVFPVEGCPSCAGQHRTHTCRKGRAEKDKDVPDTPEHKADVEPEEGEQEERQEEDSDDDKPLVTAKTSPAPLEPQARQQGVPLALRRIHQKLRDPVELIKLHLKHYHLTPNQFRRRTSALKLPDDIHRLHQETSKRCDGCNEESRESSPPVQETTCSHDQVPGRGTLLAKSYLQ